MNLVTIRYGDGLPQQPEPTDTCIEHKTWEEDRREDEAIARFRAAIGLPPRRGCA